MKRMICLAGLLAMSATARAGTCEQDFKTVGDPRNGLLYVGRLVKPGLTVSSALGQLQKIAVDDGFEVGAESIQGDKGELFFTLTTSRPPVVVRVEANSAGEVTMGTKLAAGQKMDEEDARRNICGMLGRLKTGAEGEVIATAARVKHGSDRVIDIKAEVLSAELRREIDRAKRSTVSGKTIMKDLLLGTSTHATTDQMNVATAPIVAKYRGRKYRIDGQAYTVSTSEYTGAMEAAFLVTQTRGLLGVRQSSSMNNSLNYTIVCVMAPDQAAFFSTLNGGSYMTLVGTVDTMTMYGMKLRDCRQGN